MWQKRFCQVGRWHVPKRLQSELCEKECDQLVRSSQKNQLCNVLCNVQADSCQLSKAMLARMHVVAVGMFWCFKRTTTDGFVVRFIKLTGSKWNIAHTHTHEAESTWLFKINIVETFLSSLCMAQLGKLFGKYVWLWGPDLSSMKAQENTHVWEKMCQDGL